MHTFYCPVCWEEFPKDMAECPRCGASLQEDVDQDEYVVKLIRALRHPEATTVVRAATILGLLRARGAVQPLRALLASSSDPYILESAAALISALND